jgi:hypothetical protein
MLKKFLFFLVGLSRKNDFIEKEPIIPGSIPFPLAQSFIPTPVVDKNIAGICAADSDPAAPENSPYRPFDKCSVVDDKFIERFLDNNIRPNSAREEIVNEIMKARAQDPIISSYIDLVFNHLENFKISLLSSKENPGSNACYSESDRIIFLRKDRICSKRIIHEFRHAFWHLIILTRSELKIDIHDIGRSNFQFNLSRLDIDIFYSMGEDRIQKIRELFYKNPKTEKEHKSLHNIRKLFSDWDSFNKILNFDISNRLRTAYANKEYAWHEEYDAHLFQHFPVAVIKEVYKEYFEHIQKLTIETVFPARFPFIKGALVNNWGDEYSSAPLIDEKFISQHTLDTQEEFDRAIRPTYHLNVQLFTRIYHCIEQRILLDASEKILNRFLNEERYVAKANFYLALLFFKKMTVKDRKTFYISFGSEEELPFFCQHFSKAIASDDSKAFEKVSLYQSAMPFYKKNRRCRPPSPTEKGKEGEKDKKSENLILP